MSTDLTLEERVVKEAMRFKMSCDELFLKDWLENGTPIRRERMIEMGLVFGLKINVIFVYETPKIGQASTITATSLH